MKIIITNPGRRFEERPLEAIPEDPKVRGPVARITGELDQEILGFGAALTDGACVMLNRLGEERRDALLREIFSPEESNFSIARLCVGSSDYAERVYNFAPVPDDMEMKYFDASHDDKDIIPVVKKAREYNPDLFLFTSPWSPPGWMKTSRAMQGGWMIDKYVEAYALYYLRFLQHYLKAGIKINAMTPQNETETDQTSRMPACLWHPDIEMRFAKVMRKLLDENEFADVKIWLMDHNFIMWHRVAYEMEDPEVRKACAGVAWHPYEGHPEQMAMFRRMFPESENHWTEGGMVPGAMPAPPAFGPARRSNYMYSGYGASFITAMDCGCQSVTVWNLSLDEAGYPNVGPFGCRGTVEITRDGARITRSQEYDSILHFSKYIKRGARRIVVDSKEVPSNFKVGAYRNPDGSTVVIVANHEQFDSALNLVIDGKTIPLWVLRESVNTVLL